MFPFLISSGRQSRGYGANDEDALRAAAYVDKV
jgi:hypothetical protein